MLSAESTYATFLWIVIGFDGTILLSTINNLTHSRQILFTSMLI